ncbi:unnamed protein product, partial [Ixodes persulcatus]
RGEGRRSVGRRPRKSRTLTFIPHARTAKFSRKGAGEEKKCGGSILSYASRGSQNAALTEANRSIPACLRNAGDRRGRLALITCRISSREPLREQLTRIGKQSSDDDALDLREPHQRFCAWIINRLNLVQHRTPLWLF